MELRAAKPVRLFSREDLTFSPAGKLNLAIRSVPLGDKPVRLKNGQKPALALDASVSRVLEGRGDNRKPDRRARGTPSGFFSPGSGLAKATACEDEPDAPIIGRWKLFRSRLAQPF
jgi:hypothetical protein